MLCIFIALFLGFRQTKAQDSAITEDQFWTRMGQTQTILAGAADPKAVSDQLGTLWNNVHQVRTGDSTVDVDMTWLTLPLESGEPDALATEQQQVKALLDYHAQETAGVSGKLSQSALNDVLKDPRFQYPDTTPTPLPPQPDLPGVDASGLSSGLSSLLLALLGIVVVVLALVYIARNAGTQRTAVAVPVADEPETSTDARDRADDLAAAQDYRSAIRYLYLSSLLLLNEHGLIHYDSALTNREHLRQVENKPQLLEALRRVINIFEDVWYGYAPVDEVFYRHYRQQIDTLRAFVA